MAKKIELIPNTSVILNKCRLSFVNLTKPYQYMEDGVAQGAAKWSVRAHISKTDTHVTNAIKAAVAQYKEKFDFADKQSNVHDGDKKKNGSGDPVCPGYLYINANHPAKQENGVWVDPTRLRICVVKNGEKVEISNKDAGFIRDGAIVTMHVQPAYYAGFGGGLTFYLNELLYHKQGEPFYSQEIALPDEDSELPSDFKQEPSAAETAAEAERSVEAMMSE